VAFLLDVLSAIAATIAAFILMKVVRANHAANARRAEELEAFASRVAHDIVSPLGSIGMGLELVAQRTQDPNVTSIIDRTTAALTRAGGTVRDLLSFARAGASPVPGANADLRETLDAVCEDLASDAHDADVTLKAGDMPDCTLACSSGVLTSIASNLVR